MIPANRSRGAFSKPSMGRTGILGGSSCVYDATGPHWVSMLVLIGQTSEHDAVFISHCVSRLPGGLGVPEMGVLMSVAVSIDEQAPASGAEGAVWSYIAERAKLA